MNFILFLHVLVSITLIGLILIQHGKGADAGAAFGSGSSSTVFGARGAASFLSRATSILATLFFALSLVLFISASRNAKKVATLKTPTSTTTQPVTGTRPPPVSDTPAPVSSKGAPKPVSKPAAGGKTQGNEKK